MCAAILTARVRHVSNAFREDAAILSWQVQDQLERESHRLALQTVLDSSLLPVGLNLSTRDRLIWSRAISLPFLFAFLLSSLYHSVSLRFRSGDLTGRRKVSPRIQRLN